MKHVRFLSSVSSGLKGVYDLRVEWLAITVNRRRVCNLLKENL